ncbi:hypothetical protein A2U01_0085131, partial [Trifolium medium]|nr:hypothetical protein [Trifolium medium]
PNPSCNAAHRESQPSPAQNLYTGVAGGCEVEPDAAPAVLPAVVVAVVLLLSLSAGYLISVLISKNILEAAESGDDKGVAN